MAKIEIDVDIEEKRVSKIEIPDGLNPVEVCMMFNKLCMFLLSQVKMEKAGKIEIPKSKIITGVGSG